LKGVTTFSEMVFSLAIPLAGGSGAGMISGPMLRLAITFCASASEKYPDAGGEGGNSSSSRSAISRSSSAFSRSWISNSSSGPGRPFHLVATTTTNQNGGWSYKTNRGPPRIFHVGYRFGAFEIAETLALHIRSRSTLHLSTHRTPIHKKVYFSGELPVLSCAGSESSWGFGRDVSNHAGCCSGQDRNAARTGNLWSMT
jgi:hypothetical protein